jgi:quercetin dioxygenase-like cupin family protein
MNMDYIVDLAQSEWESPAPACRLKEWRRHGVLVRLVEFARGYREAGWCTKAHTGYVLSGELDIEFRHGMVRATTGDALVIPTGALHEHRAHVVGEVARLILFECDAPRTDAAEAGGP